MSKKNPIPQPPPSQSQAFFAALLAAMRGDDKKAADILRTIGEQLLESFAPSEGVKSGRRRS
ncbi:MAG: hypothetical protein DRJ03_09370 [Chloroflexi bacterium]|nr:MAG: hypothetical protein DRJ03_09370 [Chloroflexota bacterium]